MSCQEIHYLATSCCLFAPVHVVKPRRQDLHAVRFRCQICGKWCQRYQLKVGGLGLMWNKGSIVWSNETLQQVILSVQKSQTTQKLPQLHSGAPFRKPQHREVESNSLVTSMVPSTSQFSRVPLEASSANISSKAPTRYSSPFHRPALPNKFSKICPTFIREGTPKTVAQTGGFPRKDQDFQVWDDIIAAFLAAF